MIPGRIWSSILGVALLVLGAVLWITPLWVPGLVGPAVAASEPAAEFFNLSLEGDLMSLEVEEAPLVEVLRAIQRHRSLWFWVDSSLGGATVSVRFRDRPFKEGLARLLKPFSAIKVFNEKGDIVGLYVLAPGRSAPSTHRGEYMTLSPNDRKAGTPSKRLSEERPSVKKERAQTNKEQPPLSPSPPTRKDSEFDAPIEDIQQPAGDTHEPPLDRPSDPALEPPLDRPIDSSQEPPLDQPVDVHEGPPVNQPVDPTIEPPKSYPDESMSKPPDN